MSGSATFTTVMSSSSMKIAAQTIPSVHQRRPSPRSSGAATVMASEGGGGIEQALRRIELEVERRDEVAEAVVEGAPVARGERDHRETVAEQIVVVVRQPLTRPHEQLDLGVGEAA